MNLKIVLAAVVLLSGGTYASYAQKTAAVTKVTANAAKAFENKIAAYEKEADASKAATLLETIKQEMVNGVGGAKAELAQESAKGNAAASENLMKKYETRAKSYNDVLKNASNKAAVLASLKQYAQTL